MVGLGKAASIPLAGDLGRSGTLAYGWRTALALRWRCAGAYAGVVTKRLPIKPIHPAPPTLAQGLQAV